jgi:hypothetical protein
VRGVGFKKARVENLVGRKEFIGGDVGATEFLEWEVELDDR